MIRVEHLSKRYGDVAVLKGKSVKTNSTVSGTKSVLLTPVWVTKRNVALLYRDGFVKKSEVCKGNYAKYCK